MSISCSSPQAIGYFVSTETPAHDPPVVCVISKEKIEVIIFPFFMIKEAKEKKKGKKTAIEEEPVLAVNAVSIPFDCEEDPLYSTEVCLQVLLSHRHKLRLVSPYLGARTAVEKRVLRSIIFMSELEKQEKEHENERKRLLERAEKDHQKAMKAEKEKAKAEKEREKAEKAEKAAKERAKAREEELLAEIAELIKRSKTPRKQ